MTCERKALKMRLYTYIYPKWSRVSSLVSVKYYFCLEPVFPRRARRGWISRLKQCTMSSCQFLIANHLTETAHPWPGPQISARYAVRAPRVDHPSRCYSKVPIHDCTRSSMSRLAGTSQLVAIKDTFATSDWVVTFRHFPMHEIQHMQSEAGTYHHRA